MFKQEVSGNSLELRPLQKSIKLFIVMFTYLLLADITFCLILGNTMLLISSLILLAGVIVARFLFIYDKYELGIVFLACLFYIVGFYHVIYIEDYTICYFILLLVPVIASILLENIYTKYILIIASSILFFVCNYLSGLELFENYFFFFGIIPASFLMIHFYNRLIKLANEKNKLIEELREKNEEVLLFSNMMSHDLKAPLGNIDGFSKLLQKSLTGLSEKESNMFSFIIDGVDSLKKLIDDLLKFSKISSNEYTFKEVDFEQLINKLLHSFDYDITKDNVNVVTSNLSKIYGHEESLSLVFQNLISNAIKYQPKNESHIPQIEINQSNKMESTVIMIKDNGIGIDENKFEEIFKPFKRIHSSSEYEGTGLGMSIVNKIIEIHNGTIEINSQLGKNSTFTISLPTQ